MVGDGYGTLDGDRGKAPRNFRLEWAIALLFGSYEITVSYLLVIISMAYYQKEEKTDETSILTNLCGSLLPDWQSVAVLFTFYTLLYAGVISINTMFIRSTRRLLGFTVSTWQILLHPFCRLIIGLLTFFLTCGFSETIAELKPINKLSYILCQVVMVIDAGFCFFFIYLSLRPNEEQLSTGTTLWGARQLIITQFKYAIIVCFLSTHVNVIVQVMLIFAGNTFVYICWFQLVRSGRKNKNIYKDDQPIDVNSNQS